MSFLKHARTANAEGRKEDAAWLRARAKERWAQRKTQPEPASCDDVERLLNRLPAEEADVDLRVDAMRLLTLLRVAERRGDGHGLQKAIDAIVREVEKSL